MGTTRRGTGVPALIAFMVLFSVGVALAARDVPARSPSPSPSAFDPHERDAGEQDQTSSDAATPSPSEGPSADVTAACTTALDAGTDALGRQHGLERAIEAILENCGKAPQAQGLLTALGRLQANQERQDATAHGGQPNEHANAAGNHGDAASGRPSESEAPNDPGANGRGAEHANEHAAVTSHP